MNVLSVGETSETITGFNEWDTTNSPDKKPYCCPVCGGKGLVINGFNNQESGGWTTTCRSCEGSGVVWA